MNACTSCNWHAFDARERCPPVQTCPDPEAFKVALDEYFTNIQRESEWVDTNGAEAMSAVLELVRRHQVCKP